MMPCTKIIAVKTSARRATAAVALLLMTAAPALQAIDALDKSLQLGQDNNRQEQRTQKRIDDISDRTRAMLGEYQLLGREHEALKVYNDQLERIVHSQEGEKTSLHTQLEDIELTQREIMPLMLRMIERLESFIATDSPFLTNERSQRVRGLRDLLDRADVTVAEKYRRVLEAHQVELDYGRTIETYQDELEVGGSRRTVDILRVGRIGLYYQTLDGSYSGYWDQTTGTWLPLEGSDRLAIRQGLRVARQAVAPQLLRLRVPAPATDRP
jgi:predicted RNase H-like nuclease (RuvC/YqgF family)